MKVEDMQAWILVATGAISLISLTIGILLTLREYRLKVDAERRQKRSSEVESDVRLLTIFTELMSIANGRSGYIFSDKTAEFVMGQLDDALVSVDSENAKLILNEEALRKFHEVVQDVAVMRYPIGSGQQDAAVAAIASLCRRHPQLRAVGLQGLRSLAEPPTSRVVKEYFDEVQAMLKDDASQASRNVRGNRCM